MMNYMNIQKQKNTSLNHLCDEERATKERPPTQAFLNHLCDEEQKIIIDYFAGGFLNHLCDEELV